MEEPIATFDSQIIKGLHNDIIDGLSSVELHNGVHYKIRAIENQTGTTFVIELLGTTKLALINNAINRKFGGPSRFKGGPAFIKGNFLSDYQQRLALKSLII